MVYAFKGYNNNQPYRRENSDNALETLIKRISGETASQYPNKKKTFLDRSVQKLAINSIIEGNFPKENVVRQMAIKRVNKMLCIILSMLIAVVIISYYFVITSEMKLNEISRQTIVLNNENSELQNQLDSLKSFDNVDKTLQQNNMLQRAGLVIETPAVEVDSGDTAVKASKKKFFNYAIGF